MSTNSLSTVPAAAPFDLPPTAPVLTWDTVRGSISTVRGYGQAYLLGQVWLGWQLDCLKRDHQAKGGGQGGDRKSTGHVGPLIEWNTLVEQETGMARRTADRLIQLFEAAKAKLKRNSSALQAKATLIAFERNLPLDLVADEATELRETILSLVDGETQKSLLTELAVIPTPAGMPKGGGKPKGEEPTAGQLAFAFFESMLAPIVNTRCNPDYKKLLFVLPAYATKDCPVSLDTIATECRAILADIAEVQRAQTKPAKGRTL